MQLLNPFSAQSVEVGLENLSRGGIQLRSAALICAGTLVKLRLRSAIMFGEVRYCTAGNGHFYVGVEFSHAV
jgi:PilZ domain